MSEQSISSTEYAFLATSASKGDKESLEQLLRDPIFRRRIKVICRTLFRRYGAPADRDAEDLEQDIYHRIIKHISSFDPSRAALPTWVNSIANNIQIDRLRRAAVERKIPKSDCLVPLPPMDPESRAALVSAFNRLSERQQKAVKLRWHGLGIREIAAELAISMGQVSKDLKAAEETFLTTV